MPQISRMICPRARHERIHFAGNGESEYFSIAARLHLVVHSNEASQELCDD